MNSGRFDLFSIAEDSAGLATRSTFSGVGTGQEPPSAALTCRPPETRLEIRLRCMQGFFRLCVPTDTLFGLPGVSATGAPNTACGTGGDPTTSGQRSPIALPPSRG